MLMKFRLLPIDMSHFNRQSHLTGQATYLREHLRGKLKVWCQNNLKPDATPYDLYKDGLKIYTTVDYRLQQKAFEILQERFPP